MKRRKKKKTWKIPTEWHSHQISSKYSKHFKAEEPLPLLPLDLIGLYAISQVTTTGVV